VTEVTLSLLTYFKAENVFTRFVRWRFVQSGTAGVASFEMRWA